MFKYYRNPVQQEYRLHQQQSLLYNPNRPHLNIKLDDNFEVKALVDSGSSICLGDTSIIQHLRKKFPIAPPINVTDVHQGRKQTLGCYQAMLSVQDSLPYPVKNRPINIHMQNNLSSLLVMAIGVVEFSREGYKIRKVFA